MHIATLQCVDEDGEVLDNRTVSGKLECLNHSEYSWVNSYDNFDNVAASTWCLFKVGVLFDGYEQFVEDAMDSRQVSFPDLARVVETVWVLFARTRGFIN